jgi:hypothetical protein
MLHMEVCLTSPFVICIYLPYFHPTLNLPTFTLKFTFIRVEGRCILHFSFLCFLDPTLHPLSCIPHSLPFFSLIHPTFQFLTFDSTFPQGGGLEGMLHTKVCLTSPSIIYLYLHTFNPHLIFLPLHSTHAPSQLFH